METSRNSEVYQPSGVCVCGSAGESSLSSSVPMYAPHACISIPPHVTDVPDDSTKKYK